MEAHIVFDAFTKREVSHDDGRRRAGATGIPLESLEDRAMLAAPPHVLWAVADNRGQVVIRMDAPLDPATVNTKSAGLFVGTRKVATTVAYSVKYRQITLTSNRIAPDTPYKMRLFANIMKGKNGLALDGEFKGAKVKSGDGRPGGDYIALAKPATDKIARFTTSLGIIDVRLFSTQTPLTVRNFLDYANGTITTDQTPNKEWAGRGYYDGAFFHRTGDDPATTDVVEKFVIQGGGYWLNPANGQVEEVPAQAPVPNEPRPGDPGNVKGTIAMAKLPGDPDSATNQFFFNVVDNSDNLDSQNGGFTVFGAVANAASMRVMEAIANLKAVNAGGTFSNLPVRDASASQITTADLIYTLRVAILSSVVKAGR